MHPVDLQPVFTAWVYPLCALLLTGLTAWVLASSSAWLDAHAKFLSASSKTQIANLESRALAMGTDALLQWVQTTGQKIHPTADSAVTAWAANLALTHAGGILADNGLSPDEVAAKLLARLPDTAISTDTTGAIVKTTTVTTETLQPIGIHS